MKLQVYTVAVCYRLGLGIMNNNNQTCLMEGCDAYSNQYGDHEIGCKFGGQRTTGHNKIRDTIYHTGLSACLNPQRETNNLDPESASRPADVLFTDFGTMGTVAVDVSVVSPLRADLMSHVLKEPGYALEHVRKEKLRKHHHTCQMNGMTCMPLPVETFGGWEPKAEDFIKTLAGYLSHHTGQPVSQTTKHVFEKLSVCLQKGNAALILSRRAKTIPNYISGVF